MTFFQPDYTVGDGAARGIDQFKYNYIPPRKIINPLRLVVSQDAYFSNLTANRITVAIVYPDGSWTPSHTLNR